MKSDLVDIDVILVHETEKAVLVRLDDNGKTLPVWLPLSAVEIERQPHGRARVTLPERLAIDKGMI